MEWQYQPREKTSCGRPLHIRAHSKLMKPDRTNRAQLQSILSLLMSQNSRLFEAVTLIRPRQPRRKDGQGDREMFRSEHFLLGWVAFQSFPSTIPVVWLFQFFCCFLDALQKALQLCEASTFFWCQLLGRYLSFEPRQLEPKGYGFSSSSQQFLAALLSHSQQLLWADLLSTILSILSGDLLCSHS